MVYWFTSRPDPSETAEVDCPKGFTGTIPEGGAVLYMGKDKFENEDLIKYAWPEDVWFHVDKESSAHVYIRLERGAHKTGPDWFKNIHPLIIEDCCQLVKANSIKGNKLDNVSVVFTPASNLKKTNGMETGQVGFHSDKTVFKARVQERKNAIVNRLEKTKRWEETDLEAELMRRNKEEKAVNAKVAELERVEREAQEKAWKEEKEARSYDRLNDPTQMTAAGQLEVDSDGEVDFM